MDNFGEIASKRKTGNEKFILNGKAIDLNLLSFWQWSSSDLISNSMRGMLAEYIVASAVSSTSSIRKQWEPYDVLSPKGIMIEVKSSAYLQSWAQKHHSILQFGIAETKGLDLKTNAYTGTKSRHSDIYVFCVLANKDQNTLNPLDLDQWDFYILKTEVLNRKLSSQKSIGLSSLLKLNPVKSDYKNLHQSILEVFTSSADEMP
jgi:hypothetical protein